MRQFFRGKADVPSQASVHANSPHCRNPEVDRNGVGGGWADWLTISQAWVRQCRPGARESSGGGAPDHDARLRRPRRDGRAYRAIRVVRRVNRVGPRGRAERGNRDSTSARLARVATLLTFCTHLTTPPFANVPLLFTFARTLLRCLSYHIVWNQKLARSSPNPEEKC